MRHFQGLFKETVQRMFTIDARRRKAQLVQMGTFRPTQVQMPQYADLDLFRVFREFDENCKDFLEPLEFISCLGSFYALGLQESEIVTLTLCADIDGTGRIDYQEFMKYFKDSLFWVKFQRELQRMYDEECAYAGIGSGQSLSAQAAQIGSI